MRGLLQNDPTINDAFLLFFDKVQAKANDEGSVFFLYTGDGDVDEVGEFECETLNGWLVAELDADEFESAWANGKVDESHDSEFVTVNWAVEGDDVSISFENVFA